MTESAPIPPPLSGLQAIFSQLVANPYPFYGMLRSGNPVFRVPIPNQEGAGLWLLTRHADVQAVLRDASFSVDRLLQADLIADLRLYANDGVGSFGEGRIRAVVGLGEVRV